ncbi:hypothetical protein J3Q64DRAFT_1857655 [Phycomyces blakesleeanus]|uniref:Uncharacterized protein n=2 Tax=Phycomyces blakesleeanus TaxID=4837 RepID=A0A167Q651_PHYB8|nr:hypothetical protein PHYBLDRAFT_162219 [Phycomyces blakesleeanus NRRL 1555(-)]OAD79138.1 hypothetical protein PHYBLDRAFT_162219 [Phycomyces blakesleeanus NRRL 1555(-)]|eukprot:XP_018297178.1 hypothetical protein PHYBLDRAFT_162219 [Phycomyces blakesleeanus NRRL 1555(-)]
MPYTGRRKQHIMRMVKSRMHRAALRKQNESLLCETNNNIQDVNLENETSICETNINVQDVNLENKAPICESSIEVQGVNLENESSTVLQPDISLQWKEGAGKKIRRVYRKDSATTLWRRRKAAINSAQNAEKIHKLEDLGFYQVPQTTSTVENITIPSSSQREEHLPSNSCITMYEMMKHQAVKTYLLQRIQGLKKVEASTKEMEIVYGQKNTYLPLVIRKWAKEYIYTGFISPRQQGKHAREPFLLADEGIANAVSNWIRKQEVENITTPNVKEYIDHTLFPEKFGVSGNVSLSSINRYMKSWGFTFKKTVGAVYVNNHESNNTVEY